MTAPLAERAFQAQVEQLARTTSWLVYHARDSRRSEPGFPDVALARPPRLILAELKTEAGRLTAAQRRWLEALKAVTTTEAAVWRPSDWPRIEAALVHGAPVTTGG